MLTTAHSQRLKQKWKSVMIDKIKGLLGLMRRASALALGEDDVLNVIARGKARLLLLASDVPDKQRIRAERSLDGHSTVKVILPFDSVEAGQAVGLGSCRMIAVTDIGFAVALMKLLAGFDSEKYGAAEMKIAARDEKIKRRKIDKPRTKSEKHAS